MGFKNKAIILLAAASVAVSASAQQKEQKDSLVRLIKAKSLELIEKGGRNSRRVIEGTFMHNGTSLICDTSIWHVEEKIINAWGNVKVIQDETILSSERMDYLVDENLVQCRGGVVQLEDSRHNTLRTRFLDYNTKDSLAFFKNGAAMRDSDGQIIESSEGSYDARSKRFSFKDNVNMYTDSIFIKTSLLDYESVPNRANFLAPIDFWKDGDMLSANRGWYLRPKETFFFTDKVHGTTENQEVWSDSLYYYRNTNDVLLLGQAQVQDSTREVAALANRIHYTDSLSQVTLSNQAAVALRTRKEVDVLDSAGVLTGRREQIDTLYFGADSLFYRTIPRYKVSPADSSAALSRLTEIMTDPVREYRQKAAKAAEEARAKAEEEAAKNEGRAGLPTQAGKSAPNAGAASPKADSGAPKADAPALPKPEAADTLAAAATDAIAAEVPAADGAETDEAAAPETETAAPKDSTILSAPDSLAQSPKDSTGIGFLDAKGDVRVYRYDLQMRCDSLRYNDLDSIARLYLNPVVWNDGRRQYSSDSLFALVKDNGVDRVSLQGNAFIITQENEVLFDQIKATEVMAYFDTTAALRRFDGLGGATALFFLKEKEALATVNKVETKMLSAWFKDGDIDRIYYFDSPKNDVYPLPQLKTVDRSLKGFNWQPERKPRNKQDITSLELRPSERTAYKRHPLTSFRQTDIYFPGYMKGVYKAIEEAKKRKQAGPPTSDPKLLKESAAAAEGRLAGSADSLALSVAAGSASGATDSLAQTAGGPALPDSAALAHAALPDSSALPPAAPADSLAQAPASRPDPAALRKARRDSLQAARNAAREARWAELDARDAAKAAAKAAKKEAKAKARLARQLERQRRQDLADRKKLEKYVEYYRKKKAREDARAAAKASRTNQLEQTGDKILQNYGNDTGALSPLRSGGHSERRGLPEPTLDKETTQPAQNPLQ